MPVRATNALLEPAPTQHRDGKHSNREMEAWRWSAVLALAAAALAGTAPQQVHIAWDGQTANGYPSGVAVAWCAARSLPA